MKPKVLYISEYYSNAKGGGERSAKKLITAIEKKGVKVEVLTSNKDFEVTDWRRLIYFPVYTCIYLLRRKKDYNVIHCLNSTSIYAILTKPFIRRPFVIHVNSYANLCPKGTLIYKDQEIRRECYIECTLRICKKCCAKSKLLGIKETKITPLQSIILWLRYKFHEFLLKKYDAIIPISKQAENVLLRKGYDPKKIFLIYYGP